MAMAVWSVQSLGIQLCSTVFNISYLMFFSAGLEMLWDIILEA